MLGYDRSRRVQSQDTAADQKAHRLGAAKQVGFDVADARKGHTADGWRRRESKSGKRHYHPTCGAAGALDTAKNGLQRLIKMALHVLPRCLRCPVRKLSVA